MTTKENIAKAFWKIFIYKPINKITIQELMDKAGYHRCVFYVYYKDIYDLLEQEENIIIDEINLQVPHIFYIIKNNLPASDIDTKINIFFEKNFPKVNILLGPHGDLLFILKVKKLFKKNLQDLLQLSADNYKTNLAIEFFINGHFNALLYLYKHYDKIKLADYLEMITPIFNSLFKQK